MDADGGHWPEHSAPVCCGVGHLIGYGQHKCLKARVFASDRRLWNAKNNDDETDGHTNIAKMHAFQMNAGEETLRVRRTTTEDHTTSHHTA